MLSSTPHPMCVKGTLSLAAECNALVLHTVALNFMVSPLVKSVLVRNCCIPSRSSYDHPIQLVANEHTFVLVEQQL
jgi:hypothetical protein